MQTATQVLLTVDDVSTELAIEPIEVSRLIAKRRLTATRMGADGPWRVTPDNLTKFVQAGALDLRLKDWSPLGASSWFGSSLAFMAAQFEDKLREAAAEQQPSDATLQQAFEANPDKLTITYPIAYTGAVYRVCTAPPPVSVTAPDNAITPSKFTRWVDVYFADQLRSQAAVILGNDYLDEAPFNALFDSPDRFAAVTAAAYAATAKRNIAYSHCLSMAGPKFGSAPVVRCASFVFPLATLLPGGWQQQYVDLTF